MDSHSLTSESESESEADPNHGEDACQQVCAHDASPETHVRRDGKRVAKPWEAPLADSADGNLEEAQIASQGPAQPRPESVRVPRRWDRLVRLLGNEAVQRLLCSQVTVVGLGGVGSYAAEAVARSAVGRLKLVDFDDVCVTNVNRQLQAFPGTVGQSKARLLAERVRAINPDAEVQPIQAFYDPTTAKTLLSPRPDFVIDAIDNVSAKLHLLQTCLEQGIPVVSVTGSGARLDPTQVRVDDLSKTRLDPLARVIRKEFGRRGFDTSKEIGLPVVFSEEAVREPEVPNWEEEEGGFRCICPHQADSPHACEKRRMIYGTASFVTAAFGMAATSVVIRRLANATQAEK